MALFVFMPDQRALQNAMRNGERAHVDYVLLSGLALLIKGADWLVRGASSVAKALQINDLVIGLTVVSALLLELVISLFAGSQGNGDLSSNIIGSTAVFCSSGHCGDDLPLQAMARSETITWGRDLVFRAAERPSCRGRGFPWAHRWAGAVKVSSALSCTTSCSW